ncbi:Tachykinin-like peptides receptor 99D [Trichinella nelsoni]|uniref:Tachykinin-like peptides receptor 99D n=1 Tax=Trichinella nelsoni TaxID=6336 RepID=A0A0V0RFN2_9BILA|nr:Tachykinin-like peptides receptor 99D [Trichinella nelsoni]
MSTKYEKQNDFRQKLPWLEEWRFLANNHTTSLIDVINVKLTKNEESELNELPVESKNEFINNGKVEQIITSSTFPAPFNNYPTVPSHQNSIATNFGIADQSAGLISIFGLSVSSEKLAYIIVIILITALLIISSVLTVAVIVTSPQLKDIIGYYLISLSISDLLCGTLITPVSIYAVLDENWPTAYSEIICRIEVYIELVLLSVVLYIFMWISVDRYILLTRPGRYEAEQTLTRCKCWAMFTWVTSLVLCCPVLFNELQAQYDRYAFLCVLDCTKMMPYAITMALLVIIPSLICISYSYFSIFITLRNPDELEDTYKGQLQADRSFVITFFIILSFVISWMPLIIVRLTELTFRVIIQVPSLHFTLVWLGIGSGFWKFVIYWMMSAKFRNALKSLFLLTWCDTEQELP